MYKMTHYQCDPKHTQVKWSRANFICLFWYKRYFVYTTLCGTHLYFLYNNNKIIITILFRTKNVHSNRKAIQVSIIIIQKKNSLQDRIHHCNRYTEVYNIS